MTKNKIFQGIIFIISLLLICACGGSGGSGSSSNNNSQALTPYRVYGLNFSAYTGAGQDPNLLTTLSEAQIWYHLDIIAPHTRWIRTFGSTLGMEEAGHLAKEFGLKTAIGAWLDKDFASNEREMLNLIEAAKDGYVDLAIIGSETVYRGDLSVWQLIDYIEWFRSEVPNVPVATADVYDVWLDYPELVDAVDVVLANYYPYWVGIHIDEAITYVHNRHQQVLAKTQGKKVIVSETGWPSAGETIGQAEANMSNANYYFLNFVSWARTEGIDFFYFEAFDEPWKEAYEGPQGANWGVWDSDGFLKPGMADVFDGVILEDNWTSECTPGGSGIPDIEFTYFPPKGSSNNLEGQVWHIDTNLYGVAVYIYVSGWWTKPYWAKPITEISCSGKYVTDITTGGSDTSASRIAAFLIPLDYDPPAMGGGGTLPNDLYNNAIDYIIVNR